MSAEGIGLSYLKLEVKCAGADVDDLLRERLGAVRGSRRIGDAWEEGARLRLTTPLRKID